jgi:hypothetical protein
MYDVLTYFVSGLFTGMGVLWGYWKAIPAKKKKSAYNETVKAVEDGDIDLQEALSIVGKLL